MNLADEIVIRQKLKDDLKHFSRKCLSVKAKLAGIVPFEFNFTQNYIHTLLEKQLSDTGKVDAIVLKARQQGVSTYCIARHFHKIIHRKASNAYLLSHRIDSSYDLYQTLKRFYDLCPPIIKPIATKSTDKNLFFGSNNANSAYLDSGYKIGTAGSPSVGRGGTIHFFHGSEVAQWKDVSEITTGILQSISGENGCEKILESTAHGMGNYFHIQWQLAVSGLSSSFPIFIPWFWSSEYAMTVPIDFIPTSKEIELMDLYKLSVEQICWRRKTISNLITEGIDGESMFCREYPCCSIEAFQTSGGNSFISPEIVLRARKAINVPVDSRHTVLGVDPAWDSDKSDRYAIAIRKGRVCSHFFSGKGKDLVEQAYLIHKLIEEHHPSRVFIDTAGLGCGVYDQLKHLGHGDIIVAVNAGATNSLIEPAKYKIKRDELWGRGREWLMDNCQIPDRDSLHADLCSVTATTDVMGRLMIETKKSLKSRGIVSPDEADAFCLTFALPDDAIDMSLTSDLVNKVLQSSYIYHPMG